MSMQKIDGQAPEPVFAAKDAGEVKDRTRKRKSKADQDNDDMRAVLALPEGRRVLRRVLEKASPFATTFAADAGTAAFREGHRNMGLMLVSMIADADPQALAQILVDMGKK